MTHIRWRAVSLVSALAAALPAVAQTNASPSATDNTRSAQVLASTAPFDVASIRPTLLEGETARIHSVDGSLQIENMTLALMIQIAYDVPQEEIAGGPAWIREKRFDIHAKTDGVVPIDVSKLSKDQREVYNAQKRLPMQKLLAERFGLKMHTEERAEPYYALVVAKGGARLKASDTEGVPESSALRRGSQVTIHAKGMTLEQLAKLLTHAPTGEASRPVENRTGLTGRYDFDLVWDIGLNPEDGELPPFHTALKEELGLNAEPQKGGIPVMVIDQVEMPTEN